jgi:DNA-directed RNA polymerase I, II, and III subunit RPABC2|uniref:DNA-directed RNA polymerase n=1 Tax=viral metagenome TaxID=1070528 RepID=A0A6C0JLZ9_9ZZZZ
MDEIEDIQELSDVDESSDMDEVLLNKKRINNIDKQNNKEKEENNESDYEDNDSLNEDEENDDISEIDEQTENKAEKLHNTFTEFDESEDEEDDDEFYLQKFDETTQQKIIADFHPELQTHNYDEVDVLSRVIRDEDGNIIDPLHKTLPFITRYEKARILGERAKQINSGAKPLVELEPNIIDGYIIALKEFEEKKIPFIVKRPLPNGGVEYWKVEDLEILL